MRKSIQPSEPVAVLPAGAMWLVAEATLRDLNHTCPVEYSVSTSEGSAPSCSSKRLYLIFGSDLDFSPLLGGLRNVEKQPGRFPVELGADRHVQLAFLTCLMQCCTRARWSSCVSLSLRVSGMIAYPLLSPGTNVSFMSRSRRSSATSLLASPCPGASAYDEGWRPRVRREVVPRTGGGPRLLETGDAG